ncbi:MAG: porin family protein [Saprospiraceae bacterium]|nr:porin family protein [Saprospiraceae bacterium]
MQKDTNIDNIFKQKAMNFGVKVPAAMFDNIAGDLKKRKKKKRWFLIFFLSLLPVAIAIILAIDSFYSNNGITENTDKLSKTFQHKDFSKYCFNEKNKEEAEAKAKAKAEDKEKEKEKVIEVGEKIIDEVKNDKITIEDKVDLKEREVEKEIIKPTKTTLDSVSEISIMDTIFTTTETKIDTSINSDEEENVAKTDSIRFEPEKQDTITQMPPSINVSRFTIGFSIGPGRAFRTSNVGNINEDFIAQSFDDKAISNFNRNFYIKYQLSRRFAFSTGLSFFKIGHTAKFSVPNEYLRYIHAENFGHTSAGFYDLDIKEVESILKSNDFYTIDCIRKFEDIQMKINVTDIPFSLSYNFLLKNRIKLELMGGLNMAFLGKSEVEIGLNNNYYSVGNMSNLQKSIFGFSTGLGISYEIYNGFNFRLDPIYRRYFNTVSTSESFKYMPYTFSVNGGFSLSF